MAIVTTGFSCSSIASSIATLLLFWSRIMTISAAAGANSMGDGMVKIEVINLVSPTNRTGTAVMKVPFASLSRTMQFIHRSGGKIASVTKLGSNEQFSSQPSLPTPVETPATAVAAAPAPIDPPVVEPQSAQSAPKAAQSTNNNKKRGKNKR
jgi:hypothetical protein